MKQKKTKTEQVILTTHYHQYVKLFRKLDALIKIGRSASEPADELRSELDKIWQKLSDDEVKQIDEDFQF
jgi:hypothetical protein